MEDYDRAGDYYLSALQKSRQIQDTEGEMLWSFFLGFMRKAFLRFAQGQAYTHRTLKSKQKNDGEAYALLKRSVESLS